MNVISGLHRLKSGWKLHFLARNLSLVKQQTTYCGHFKSSIEEVYGDGNFRKSLIPGLSWSHYMQHRWKSHKSRQASKKSGDDEEGDFVKEINSDDINAAPGDYKDVTTHVSSMRLDNVLKSALGIPKSDIEAAFYASNIRLNGRKVLKKSIDVDVGDEIDIIKGVSPTSDKFLEVMRTVILAIKLSNNPEASKIQVKLRRFKQLIIENYDDSPFHNKDQ